jgi:hypothetical protein
MRKQFQHVIEKANAGGNLVSATPFNREAQSDTGFFGGSVECGLSHRATF